MLLPLVCLFVCLQDYSNSYKRILMKFLGGVGRGLRDSRLDFSGIGNFLEMCIYVTRWCNG